MHLAEINSYVFAIKCLHLNYTNKSEFKYICLMTKWVWYTVDGGIKSDVRQNHYIFAWTMTMIYNILSALVHWLDLGDWRQKN